MAPTPRLDHVGLLLARDEQVVDVARFFTDVLGWTVSGDPAAGYTEVDAGGQHIALHRGALVEAAVTPHGGTLLQTT